MLAGFVILGPFMVVVAVMGVCFAARHWLDLYEAKRMRHDGQD